MCHRLYKARLAIRRTLIDGSSVNRAKRNRTERSVQRFCDFVVQFCRLFGVGLMGPFSCRIGWAGHLRSQVSEEILLPRTAFHRKRLRPVRNHTGQAHDRTGRTNEAQSIPLPSVQLKSFTQAKHLTDRTLGSRAPPGCEHVFKHIIDWSAIRS